MVTRRQETAGLFLSHGVLDALTTTLAYTTIGPGGEANPLIGRLLDVSVVAGVGVMLAVVATVGVVYPRLAAWSQLPWWFAAGLIGFGLGVVAVNLLVVVLAGWPMGANTARAVVTVRMRWLRPSPVSSSSSPVAVASLSTVVCPQTVSISPDQLILLVGSNHRSVCSD